MVGVNWRIATDDNGGMFDDSIHKAYGRNFEDELTDQKAGMHSLYMGFNKEELIATGFIRWCGPRPVEAFALFPDVPEIFRLGVNPKFQSCGIGTSLLRLLEAEADSRGDDSVGIGVSHTNDRARKLYCRLGYANTIVLNYIDQYQYRNGDSQVVTARDPCSFMLKRF